MSGGVPTMNPKAKTVFVCQNCGYESLRWAGKCPDCGEWNTLQEEIKAPVAPAAKLREARPVGSYQPSVPIGEITAQDEGRASTGSAEFDRVLGGGMVQGSLVLLGGDPGIGKSTILLQICGLVRDKRVLYISGEESKYQIKMRADRLGIAGEGLSLASHTDIGDILASIEAEQPDVVIVDSIQTMYLGTLSSSAGSVSQVRECTSLLMRAAKTQNVTVFVVGHVNKDGAIAGPKVLEHIVDTVLYFEGERGNSYRILRAVKNRFGSTNEIGVFEMTDKGLIEVDNPSMIMLSGRPVGAPGSCVTCVMEGSRPLLLEVQALLAKSALPSPRRTAAGFDYNRFALLCAVVEKRGGYPLSSLDAFLNVVGGFKLDEPAADLAVVTAMISSILDQPVPADTIVFGEVGLSGEVRSCTGALWRISEAERMGFSRCVLPKHTLAKLQYQGGMQLIGVKNIAEAVAQLRA